MGFNREINRTGLTDTTNQLHANSTNVGLTWAPPNRAGVVLNPVRPLDFSFAHAYSIQVPAASANPFAVVLVRPMMLASKSSRTQARRVKAAYYEGGYVPGKVPNASGVAVITDSTHLTCNITANAGELMVWYLPDDDTELEILDIYDAGKGIRQGRLLAASLRALYAVIPYNLGSKLDFGDPHLLVDGFHLGWQFAIPTYDEASALGAGGHGKWVDISADATPVTSVSFEVEQVTLGDIAREFGKPDMTLAEIRDVLANALHKS